MGYSTFSAATTRHADEVAERRRLAPPRVIALEQLLLGCDSEKPAPPHPYPAGAVQARKPCAATCAKPCDCDHD